MRLFSGFSSIKNIQLPSQSYFLGFILSISFGLFYECTVPGMGEHRHTHSHEHAHDPTHENNHGNHDHHHSGNTQHHGEANQHMHQMDVKDLAKRFDDPRRDKWQKPNLVIQRIEKEIQDSKITKPVLWEIGAGSGYFSTKFIKQDWVVIAADPNPEFLNILQGKKKALPKKEQSHFFIQKIPYDKPSIHRKDVNLVFSSNTYHHIENRADYFRDVKNALAENGSLIILDFEKGKSGMGPPQNMRFTPPAVIAELKQAGFTRFDVDSKSFPYQFLLVAK